MKTALVLMTILGCDDSATECHYVATLPERWASVELCDSVSEQRLEQYSNAPYPVVVAVCQNPEEHDVANSNAATPATAAEHTESVQSEAAVTPGKEEGMATKAISRVRNILPSTEGVKTLLTRPVRIVENGYSWVAKRFTPD